MKHAPEEIEKILDQVSAWGFAMTPSRASLLAAFASILESYEEANVIGTRRLDEIVADHVLDSLSCLLFGPSRNAKTLVDVGSGGGLPGVPIGIAADGLRVSLVEATAKKARFLEHATRQLGASNFQIVNRRAEEVGRAGGHRGRYDIATARALASLDVLAEYCLPLVETGGYVIAMKGNVEKDELRRGKHAASLLGGEISEVFAVSRLPEYERKQRHLVVFTKMSETPDEYPRRIGLPAKNPLGEIGNR